MLRGPAGADPRVGIEAFTKLVPYPGILPLP